MLILDKLQPSQPAGLLRVRPLACALLWAVMCLNTAQAQTAGVASLKTLMAEAVGSHPLLQARQSGIDAAESGIDEARWQYWATPSVSMDHAGRSLLPGTDRHSTVLSLRQPLWTGGKLDAELAGARAVMSSAQAQKEEARRDLALDVIQAYADHYTAHARLAAYDTSLEIHDTLLAQVRRRAAEGLSAHSDVQLALSRQTGLQADRLAALSQAASAVQKLRSLVGHSVTPARSAPAIAAPGVEQGATLVAQALALDPTMARLQAESQQLKAQADVAAAARWPQVYAGLSQRRGDLTGTNTQLMIGLQASLGAGLSTSAAIRAAQQRFEGKRGELEARERTLGERIESDLLQVQSAQLRVAAYRDAIATATEVCASWRRQFIAGKKAWQDVMNAERDVSQTEVQLADATGTLLSLQWRLAVLAGGVDAVLQMAPGGERP